MNEVLCLNPTHTLSIYDKDVLFAKETCCHWKKGMLQQLNKILVLTTLQQLKAD